MIATDFNDVEAEKFLCIDEVKKFKPSYLEAALNWLILKEPEGKALNKFDCNGDFKSKAAVLFIHEC